MTKSQEVDNTIKENETLKSYNKVQKKQVNI